MMRNVPWRMVGAGVVGERGGPIGGTSSHAATNDGSFYSDFIANAATDFTLESWLRFTASGSATVDIADISVDKWGLEEAIGVAHGSWSDGVAIDLTLSVREFPAAGYPHSALATVSLAGFVAINTWAHLALTNTKNVDGTYTLRAFRNGIKVAEEPSVASRVYDDSVLRLRGDTTQPGLVHFDEVRLWKKARTEAQILAGISQQMDPYTTGLTRYWRLDNSLASAIPGHAALNLSPGTVTYLTDTPF